MSEQSFEVECGFFDSVNKDRLYSADEMNRPYKRIITNGIFATPTGTPSTDLQVVASSEMNVIVKKGDALFADKWFSNPSEIAITIPANSSIVPRIDSVIARVDKTLNGRKGKIVYKTGEPSSNPQPPTINTDTNIIEYRLANIYVVSNAVSISQSNITDLRGSEECPWITSLIKQVDTSELFRQWEQAYNEYYNSATGDFNEYTQMRKAEFDQFLDNLTSQLEVATNVILLDNNYISKNTVTNVPIGIPSFDPDTDVLIVFINGLRATEELNYTINANKTSIDLNVELLSGQAVNFLVLKSVIGADIQTTITLIQQLNSKINELEQRIEVLEEKNDE